MQPELYEYAAVQARKHYAGARSALLAELETRDPAAGFDASFHLSVRAMQLHVSSLSFAAKVWSGSFAYERAEAALVAQFPEFPIHVVANAFSTAYTDSR